MTMPSCRDTCFRAMAPQDLQHLALGHTGMQRTTQSQSRVILSREPARITQGLEALSEISGVGAAKREAYGEAFLAVIREAMTKEAADVQEA